MKPWTPIRVLVIDDSAFSRQTIARMLDGSPLVQVVGSARDGEEAIRLSRELEPDLVTLDLEMPKMDGFTFLRLVMAHDPVPVMVISGRSHQQDVFKALDLGAVDFIAKPDMKATPELENIQQELIRKVHAIRQLRLDKLEARVQMPPPVLLPGLVSSAATPRVVAMGASTGGPSALLQVLGAFTEAPACSVLVAQHMPAGFTKGFADRLDRLTPFRVREAAGGESLEAGQVLIAPGGCHLELETRGSTAVAVVRERARNDKYSPSVDRLFESAAKHVGSDLLAVVLTGMGDDGRHGSQSVRAAGGLVIAESEESAVIAGMPQQAVRGGAVNAVLPLAQIPGAILNPLAIVQKEGRQSSQPSERSRQSEPSQPSTGGRHE